MKKITAAHLIDDYLSLKKQLGRRPVCVEFARYHHSIGTLCTVFDGPGWSSLLKAAGEEGAKFTREHLLNDYHELKRELGKAPTSLEYAAKHHCIATLCKVFERPGWTNLLIAAGETPRLGAGVNREHLINDYHELRRELGRRPVCREFEERHHRFRVIQGAFGRRSWSALQKAAGEDLESPRFTREALIRDYLSLKAKLGRQPRADEFAKECRGKWIVDRAFGKPGWRKLVRAAGDAPFTEQDLSAEHLIGDFLELQARLGRRPLSVEYRDQCHHTLKVLDRVFGKPGWRNFVKAIGGKALPRNVLSAEHLIQDYLDTCDDLGYRPSYGDFQARHIHSMKVLVRVFGAPGWSNLEKAALNVRPVQGKARRPHLKADLQFNIQG